MISNRQAVYVVVGVLVLLACLARSIHLDADPHFPTWTQYVVDEGRWNEVARNLALFDALERTRLGQLHLMLSPGYQAVNYLVFKLFGVGFETARALAALSGSLIVIVIALAMRRHVTLFALLLGVVIVGFETGLLAESRLALPEIPSLLAILLAFLLLVLGRHTRRNAFVAGLLALGGIAMKATSVLVVPALPLVILLLPHAGPLRDRFMRLAWFSAGFVIPTLLGAAVAWRLGLLDPETLGGPGRRILGFLAFADPRFIVWRFFDSTQLEIRNLLILGAWLCSWLWVYRAPGASRTTRDLYLMSGLWAGWWLVLWSVNDYSPGRYVVHFVVPAVLHLMAGLSLGDRESIERAAQALARKRGVERWAALIWLVLPSAILLVPFLTGLGELAGLGLTRVSDRVLAVAALTAFMVLVMKRRVADASLIAELLALPILLMLLWLAGRELGFWRHFWTFESGRTFALWVTLAGIVTILSYLLARYRKAREGYVAMQCVVLMPLAAIFLAEAAVPIVAPTYSLRDASREIGRRLASASQIRVVSASSLFLENELRYRELGRADAGYDAVVMFEHNMSSQRYLTSPWGERMSRVATFPVIIHPRYEFDPVVSGPPQVGIFVPK